MINYITHGTVHWIYVGGFVGCKGVEFFNIIITLSFFFVNSSISSACGVYSKIFSLMEFLISACQLTRPSCTMFVCMFVCFVLGFAKGEALPIPSFIPSNCMWRSPWEAVVTQRLWKLLGYWHLSNSSCSCKKSGSWSLVECHTFLRCNNIKFLNGYFWKSVGWYFKLNMYQVPNQGCMQTWPAVHVAT